MEQILSDIGYFLLKVMWFIGAIYFYYIVYFRDRPTIPDEDLDRVVKGSDS